MNPHRISRRQWVAVSVLLAGLTLSVVVFIDERGRLGNPTLRTSDNNSPAVVQSANKDVAVLAGDVGKTGRTLGGGGGGAPPTREDYYLKMEKARHPALLASAETRDQLLSLQRLRLDIQEERETVSRALESPEQGKLERGEHEKQLRALLQEQTRLIAAIEELERRGQLRLQAMQASAAAASVASAPGRVEAESKRPTESRRLAKSNASASAVPSGSSSPPALDEEFIHNKVAGAAALTAPASVIRRETFQVILYAQPGASAPLVDLAEKEVENRRAKDLARGRNAGPTPSVHLMERASTLTPTMTAKLTGPGFTIVPADGVTQAVSVSGPTTWTWQVTPVDHGRLKLLATLTGSAVAGGKEAGRNYYYDHELEVSVGILGFVEDYWQWITSAVILPLAVWLWGKLTGPTSGHSQPVRASVAKRLRDKVLRRSAGLN